MSKLSVALIAGLFAVSINAFAADAKPAAKAAAEKPAAAATAPAMSEKPAAPAAKMKHGAKRGAKHQKAESKAGK